ncbi:RNA polymerase, sigma-24 subunit, ECF subfamily [Pseudopedobacter saltans DSM 12145]|uniref:RNA polymerase, sigma-24 subunit, ECF subfamily n=1 Tax=Pseudopedobacter saltans (strain ATCC 51119 / DSM 12145 / JCM 21818 / CCUG 39354 / LMG 10337 / NBRC 100064 / NCIMB 13643) TaxID=762903 RepID=F0S965_PSESL|nr:RNA polymerase sigma-70 factor [Pseudopedobacter saltans]ADY51363.1 RNA polymerase, sigma-24 subunit, ECF subfamily [Pseudopedobacter saltans DSM 12145]
MAIKPLDNETELLAKIAEGDHIAFSELFTYYRKYVFSFGSRLMRSEEVAEEVVQEVFTKIWRGREKLKTIDNFAGYLSILVRNHSFDLLRQLARQQKTGGEIVLLFSEEDNSTQNEIDYRETVRILDEVLDVLPEQQRRAYTLCHLEGLKYEEAATIMNISATTVNYHMKLALKNIRQHLLKNGLSYQIILFLFYKF